MTKILFIFLMIIILCILKILKIHDNNNINENFIGNDNVPNIANNISFKKIISNRLYYGLSCNYMKDDSFYDALKKNNFKVTNNIKDACLIVPCTYETIDTELMQLDKEGITENIFGDGVRIFMLDNTDHMVSKILLWKYLINKYGKDESSKLIPYTWDLTDPADFEQFKNQYNDSKIYITKNNQQRQEGIEIHSSIDSIIKSKDKYLLVQELLQDPYLINGRKINLRVYVLVIKDNYGNIKLQIYKDGFMYYTPELFQKNDSSFERNITTGYVDRQIYIDNPLTHIDFRKFLDDPSRKRTLIEEYYRTAYNNKLSDYIFSQIYQLIATIFKTYQGIIGTKTYGVSFQLYGVDIAINDKLQSMIMEINKGPDLTAKDTRDKELKLNLCTDILRSLGLIDESDKNNFLTVLELVNIDDRLVPISNFIEY
jgi:hypothetical protein